MILPIVVAFISTSGCSKDKGTIGNAFTLPDTVRFSKDIQPIFNMHCSISGCHNSISLTGKLDLSPVASFSNLFRKHEIDTIYPSQSMLYMEVNGPMPPTGRMGDRDVAIILKWIQQKAKNN